MAPISPAPFDDVPADGPLTAADGAWTPVPEEPDELAAHVLDREAEHLHSLHPEVGDVASVRALLRGSYARLARTSRRPDMLVPTAVRYAAGRLRAQAITQGSVESSEPRVLFVCHGNAGRSQMAAALLENRSGGAVQARSAGTHPAGEVLSLALDVMREVGVPLHHAFPKPVDADILRAAELVVLFDGAGGLEVPEGVAVQEWSVPSIRGMGVEQVRGVRDALDLQVRGLIAELDGRG